MVQARKLVIVAGAAAAALVVLRRGRHGARGHQVPGGIIIGDAVVYNTLSRLLLGPFLARIAADVAAVAPDGARVLEVGCGPGHLSVQLARQHGLEVGAFAAAKAVALLQADEPLSWRQSQPGRVRPMVGPQPPDRPQAGLAG